jgi:hypothetical protein
MYSTTAPTDGFAAESHAAGLRSILNKAKYLRFGFGTRRPTVFERVEEYFELL